MKLALFLSFLTLTLNCFGESLRIEVLIVRLPEARAVELVPKLRTNETCAAAKKEIIAMLGKEAELVDWPMITARPGQQVFIENTEVLRFPTEYDQPIILVDTKDDSLSQKPANATPGSEPEKAAKPAEPAVRMAGAVPSSFEVKILGVTVQAEGQFSPTGKSVTLNLSLSHSSLLGWKKESIEAGPHYKVTVEQPRVKEIKTTNTYDLAHGESQLVSFSKLDEPAGKIEIAILTLAIIPDVEKAGDK